MTEVGTMPHRLAELRERLDVLDREIASKVADRFQIIRAIGDLKREHKIPVMQEARMKVVLSRAEQLEAHLNIPVGTLTAIFATLIAGACRVEEAMAGPASD